MSKQVWLTQIGEPVPLTPHTRRMRTGLLAEALARHGHEVTWWGSTFDHGTKTVVLNDDATLPISEGLRIRALGGKPYSKNLSVKRLLNHREIARRFSERARREPRPDVIVASMPDYHLAHAAAEFARERNIPYVVDVRDQWPDIFLDFVPQFARPLAKIALAPDRAKLRTLLRGASSITTMMESSLQWALSHAGRSRGDLDQVFYIGAKPWSSSQVLPANDPIQALVSELRSKVGVSFVGTFGFYNSAETVVRAAREFARLRPDRSDVLFVVGGDGVRAHEVREAARGLENVRLPGWLNEAQMNAILSASHVGVIPCRNKTDAFPNKAFLYLSAGLPLVSSVTGELEGLIRSANLGRTFKPGDAQGLARAIVEVVDDPVNRTAMAASSAETFKRSFDANEIYARFAEHVERVAESTGRSEPSRLGLEAT